jgi:hypothetical protein
MEENPASGPIPNLGHANVYRPDAGGNRPFRVVAVLDARLSSLQVPNQLPLLQKFFQLRLHGHLEKFPGAFPEILRERIDRFWTFFPL